MISAGVTVMGSLGLWKEPQSPSPDPFKGWMCNVISWTGRSRLWPSVGLAVGSYLKIGACDSESPSRWMTRWVLSHDFKVHYGLCHPPAYRVGDVTAAPFCSWGNRSSDLVRLVRDTPVLQLPICAQYATPSQALRHIRDTPACPPPAVRYHRLSRVEENFVHVGLHLVAGEATS